MSFFNGLKNFFTAPVQSGSQDFITVIVQCDKCGEQIAVKLRKTSDISRIYEGEDSPVSASYYVRKEILGNKCNNLIYFKGYFDEYLNLISSDITGGKIIE